MVDLFFSCQTHRGVQCPSGDAVAGAIAYLFSEETHTVKPNQNARHT
eukprot:COSAG06_NODE_46211_length_348_cov_1.437751_1_plen_46_part_10